MKDQNHSTIPNTYSRKAGDSRSRYPQGCKKPLVPSPPNPNPHYKPPVGNTQKTSKEG